MKATAVLLLTMSCTTWSTHASTGNRADVPDLLTPPATRKTENSADEILQELPAEIRAHVEMALHRLTNGQLDQAVDNFTGVRKRGLREVDLTTWAADCCLAAAEYDEAAELYKIAVSFNPDDSDFYKKLGIIELKLQRYDEAEHYFNHALKLAPKDADLYFCKGTSKVMSQRVEEAIALFRKAIDLAPRTTSYYCALALAWLKLDKTNEALHILEKAQRLNLPDAYLHRLIGDCYLERRKYTNAAREYLCASKLMPQAGLSPKPESNDPILLLNPDRPHYALPGELYGSLAIRVMRPSKDSCLVEDQVRTAVGLLPSALNEKLRKSGLTIQIIPFKTFQTKKSLPQQQVGDIEQLSGLFMVDSNQILLPENGPTSKRTIFHELGHASEHCLGDCSSSLEFRLAYAADCSRLTDAQRAQFWYFLQPHSRGPRELFADLFACKWDDNPADQSLCYLFPESYKSVCSLLNTYL